MNYTPYFFVLQNLNICTDKWVEFTNFEKRIRWQILLFTSSHLLYRISGHWKYKNSYKRPRRFLGNS